MTADPFARLRRRAEGLLLVHKHDDGTETVFCSDGPDGEYIGWQERSYADSKGYNYQAPPEEDTAALLAAYDDAISALVYIGQRYGRLDGVDWDRVLP